jgi:hypothetical protein
MKGNPMANFAESFPRIELKPRGIAVSEDVRKFLCEELPQSEAHMIVSCLDDLERIIRESFGSVISVSLEIFENPELPDERNIRIRIRIKETVENGLQQYDRYTRAFIQTFPFEFGRWFVTSVNYV